jgi:hypothetical protein
MSVTHRSKSWSLSWKTKNRTAGSKRAPSPMRLCCTHERGRNAGSVHSPGVPARLVPGRRATALRHNCCHQLPVSKTYRYPQRRMFHHATITPPIEQDAAVVDRAIAAAEPPDRKCELRSTRLMLIHAAALFDKRWVWHVKPHDNLSSVVIFGCYGNGTRTKDLLQRMSRDGGRDLVRS